MKTYFLQMDSPGQGMGPIKIGKTTKSVEERLKQIDATGTPFPVRILYWIPGDHEAELHRRFGYCRIRNNREWFRPTEELCAYIHNLMNSTPESRTPAVQYQYEDHTWNFIKACGAIFLGLIATFVLKVFLALL